MAAKYDFSLDKGSDFTLHLAFKDKAGKALELEGTTAKMHIKCRCTDPAPFDELTTENGRITLANDRISLIFPHDVSRKYEAQTGVYDLLVTLQSGRVLRMLEGRLTVRPGVTV